MTDCAIVDEYIMVRGLCPGINSESLRDDRVVCDDERAAPGG